MKNLYNENYINILSLNISSNYPKFDKVAFTNTVFDNLWQTRELKQRMRHIANTLLKFIPEEYSEAIDILKSTFFQMNDKYILENMIFQDFVEVYGMNHFDTSMEALESFTINSSSEFAIRQFILKYPDKTMAQMRIWAKSDNEHLRRLSSEGCRPRLPWAIALKDFKKNPQEVLKILEILKNDESKYVRKSVANNINDISKDNPHIVKEFCKKYFGITTNMDAMLKHGCRTLLKNGDKDVLEIFGFVQNKNIQMDNFNLDKEVSMGEKLNFSFNLQTSKELGKLRIEFSITFARLNNKYNTKVFKISEGTYQKNSLKVSKQYSFKPISTRKYYLGMHKLAIIVNGIILNEEEFLLT